MNIVFGFGRRRCGPGGRGNGRLVELPAIKRGLGDDEPARYRSRANQTDMCILNRTFAIKQMTKWGVKCILIRDLTDSMYDPDDAPHVTHQRGTEMVIEHIEKYWAPTITSPELLSALR